MAEGQRGGGEERRKYSKTPFCLCKQRKAVPPSFEVRKIPALSTEGVPKKKKKVDSSHLKKDHSRLRLKNRGVRGREGGHKYIDVQLEANKRSPLKQGRRKRCSGKPSTT